MDKVKEVNRKRMRKEDEVKLTESDDDIFRAELDTE
jgi:hypothetical protein